MKERLKKCEGEYEARIRATREEFSMLKSKCMNLEESNELLKQEVGRLTQYESLFNIEKEKVACRVIVEQQTKTGARAGICKECAGSWFIEGEAAGVRRRGAEVQVRVRQASRLPPNSNQNPRHIPRQHKGG
eukprot:TRINITY_DN6868_c1_g1_i1.p1 TRINITY_DN6868_c1_g1~~TRINITY_DN6868_c1_g1_i1.p1  ORF type:complete len:144 (-),score=24.58 TRINITY_DN6868_c1_g1_i1:370-765(-)